MFKCCKLRHFWKWFSTSTKYQCRWKWEQNCVLFKKWSSNFAKYVNFHTHFQHLLFQLDEFALKLLFAFVQSHESQIDDGVSLHVSGSFTWDTWNDNWCYQVLIQAYRPISLKAKHFGFWREEAQFSSCLEFLCSSRLIKGQWCFCPTSQLTGNYVFTIICNVIYKLYEILKNVGKCVLGDL